MKHLILPTFLIGVLIMTGCKKENTTEEETPQQPVKITADILSGQSAGSLRIWYVLNIQKQFYNSRNELDSTFKPTLLRPIDSYVAFLHPDKTYAGGSLDVVENYTAMGHILQGLYSDWQVNDKGDSLRIVTTITIGNPPYDWGTRADRIFQIKSVKLNAGLGYNYDYGIEASCTTSLTDGRKLKETFAIGAMK